MPKRLISLTYDEAIAIELTKWPQVFITGNKITQEQAKELIFKTDTNIQNIDWFNSVYSKTTHRQLGYDLIPESCPRRDLKLNMVYDTIGLATVDIKL